MELMVIVCLLSAVLCGLCLALMALTWKLARSHRGTLIGQAIVDAYNNGLRAGARWKTPQSAPDPMIPWFPTPRREEAVHPMDAHEIPMESDESQTADFGIGAG